MSEYKILVLCIIFGLAILVLCMAFLGNKKKKLRHKGKKESNWNSVHVKRDDVGNRAYPPSRERETISWNAANVKLNDSKDRAYTLPNEEESSLQHTKFTVLHNTRASERVGLSKEWLDKLSELVRSAYIIYKNADSPRYTPSAAAYNYFKGLYHRSVAAGQLLEAAEKNVGDKVLLLHQIRFSNIGPDERREIIVLQEELPKLQSLLSKAKSRVWKNTHELKLLIKRCGRQGNAWYCANEMNRERRCRS